jgi:hypothetical protein
MSEAVTIYETHATGHWKELFASKNKILGGHNLEEGEEICATIAGVGSEQVYDKEDKQNKDLVVLKFQGNIPPMALNITNADTISLIHGNKYSDWVGKRILIHTAKVKAFGKMHDALRVRPKVPRENDYTKQELQLRSCANIQELQKAFLSLPKHVQGALVKVKDEMKGKLA